MAVMYVFSLWLPNTPEEAAQAGPHLNLMALFITKTNSVLFPLLIIDLVRRWQFPYLDLSRLVEDGNMPGVLFLSVIYGVFVYAFAVGG